MPAQGITFIFYILFSIIIFPLTFINFLILNTPFLGGVKSFVVTTGSMEPVIQKGSLIYTLGKPDYKNGDIITFADSVGVVSHRIIKTLTISGMKYYSTKGDTNNTTDVELISTDAIYGKIVGVVPIVGRVVLFYRTPLGLITGAIFPMLILLYIIYFPPKSFALLKNQSGKIRPTQSPS